MDTIIELFHVTWNHNPTHHQISIVNDILDGKFDSSIEMMDKMLDWCISLRRWRDFPNMHTVDTVHEHQLRVAQLLLLTQHYISFVYPWFDFEKALFLAQYHDATEGLSPFGDIPTPIKSKLSPKHKALLAEVEMKIVWILSNILHTSYYREHDRIKEILLESIHKNSLESQVVKYFDIVDGFMVAFSEYNINPSEEWYNVIQYYQRNFSDIQKWEYLAPISGIFSKKIEVHEWLDEVFDDDYKEQNLLRKMAWNLFNFNLFRDHKSAEIFPVYNLWNDFFHFVHKNSISSPS